MYGAQRLTCRTSTGPLRARSTRAWLTCRVCARTYRISLQALWMRLGRDTATRWAAAFAAGLQGQVGENTYVDAMKSQINDAHQQDAEPWRLLMHGLRQPGCQGSSGYRDRVQLAAMRT